VPVVGRLFGGQRDESGKTEVVLSITPRILRSLRRPDASVIEFESGTESSLGARATTVPAALPAPPPPVIAPPRSPSGAAPAGEAPGTIAQPAAAAAPPNGSAVPTPSTPAATAPSPAPEQGSTPAAATGPAVLRWQGPTEVKVGDTFSVQLVMQSDQPVVSVPMAVGFDPRVLQVLSVQEGEFLRQGGAAANFASRVDPSGQVLVTGTRSGDTGATNIGIVTTLSLRAVAATTADTRLQLTTAAPVGLGGRAVVAQPTQPLVLRVIN
jgi:general secretion pathway protein D